MLSEEIENTHHVILSLLLQKMDEGRLTENTGKHINFSHMIIS